MVAFGRVTVYPRDGCYQLYVDMMAPKGVGDQSVAFEKLKQKLAAEGLFDEAHKKPIPVCRAASRSSHPSPATPCGI